MTLRFTPVSDGFAAVAGRIDLSLPLNDDVIAAISDAIDRWGVIVFEEQDLSVEQQIAFAARFGRLDTQNQVALNQIQARIPFQEVSDISNVAADGSVASANHAQTMMNIGNRLWHSDSSFMRYPWRYSFLYAVSVVRHGGETQWADLRGAYEALAPEDKELAESLVVEHFAGHTRALLGQGSSIKAPPGFEPSRWPLVRIHPPTGRKMLWVSSAIREVIGMSLPEGRALMLEFLEHATQPAFVFTHRWRPGDLAVWDNRVTLHRGKRFDMSERREMRRVATVDDVASLSVPEADRTRIYGQACI